MVSRCRCPAAGQAEGGEDREVLADFGLVVAEEAAVGVRTEPGGDGVVAVFVDGPSITFQAHPDERFYGFGERSHRCQLRGEEDEHYIGAGPYQPEGYDLA